MTIYEVGITPPIDDLDNDANGEIQEINTFNVQDSENILNRTDTFEFTVDTSLNNSYIQLYLHDLGGDADVRLFQDEDSNGLFDSGVDTTLATDLRFGDNPEVISFYYPGNIGTGTFIPLVAEVRNFDSETVFYDFDIVAVSTGPSQSMNPIALSTGTPVNLLGNVKGISDPFRKGETATTYLIDAEAAGSASANVSSATGSPILRAFEDSNENGIFDSDDALLDESTSGSLVVEIGAGLGFWQVARPASDSSGFSYEFDLLLDADFNGRLDGAIGFDPVQYLASYSDLIASLGLNPAAATQHYEQFGQIEERSDDLFDEVRYLASNGDLIAAFGPNFDAASEHYVAFGATEGRPTDTFDPIDYLNANPDLQAVFGNNVFEAALHYIQSGFFEGRDTGSGSPDFDGRLDGALDFNPVQYLASYDDLITAFGLNPAAATQHYNQFGLREGRLNDLFDEVRYIASNGDLISTFGTNFEGATEHYVSFGAAEGRPTEIFDPIDYLNANPDLQAAFGNNLFDAALHYIQFGFAEGRTF